MLHQEYRWDDTEMDEISSTPTLLNSKKTIIAKDLSPESISKTNSFLKNMGVFNLTFPAQYDTKDSFSELTRCCLKVQHIHRGKISCFLSVKPPIMVNNSIIFYYWVFITYGIWLKNLSLFLILFRFLFSWNTSDVCITCCFSFWDPFPFQLL